MKPNFVAEDRSATNRRKDSTTKNQNTSEERGKETCSDRQRDQSKRGKMKKEID